MKICAIKKMNGSATCPGKSHFYRLQWDMRVLEVRGMTTYALVEVYVEQPLGFEDPRKSD